MIIGHEIRKYREAIAAGISELVQIRSVKEAPEPGKPFGPGVDRALRHMLGLAESLGFETANVDGYAGHAEYGQGEGLAAVLVHLDTVEEGDGWTYPPFGGIVENGKIIGRGASDNKGPAVAALYALKTLKDLGIAGSRRLRLIFGTNEESGMKDLDYYFEKEPLPDMAFAPDAGYPIFNVEMGNMNVELACAGGKGGIGNGEGGRFGAAASEKPQLPLLSLKGGSTLTLVPKTCAASLSLAKLDERQAEAVRRLAESHANISAAYAPGKMLELTACGEAVDGSPTGSPNAIANMAAFLLMLNMDTGADGLLRFLHEKLGAETNGQSLGIACSDSESGGLVVYLRTIASGPDGVRALCNIRYPVSQDGERIFAAVSRVARDYGVAAGQTRHLLPVYVPETHPVIGRLSRAYEKMTGEKAVMLRMGAGTYARKLRNNGVAFGAGLPGGVDTRVHQADEFIFIDDMMRHAEICLQGMYELLGRV